MNVGITALAGGGPGAAAVSLLRPGEVFSIHAFDLAQTETAAAS